MKSIFFSFLYSLALCVCYYVLARAMPTIAFENLNVGSQWQDNASRATVYAGRHEPAKLVLLGSSLTARIPVGMESEGSILNLAFGGDSAATGMHLIMHTGNLPKVVGIELNFADKAENNELIERVFGWRGQILDRLFPWTMEIYSPPRLLLYGKKLKSYKSRPPFNDLPDVRTLNRLTAQQEKQFNIEISAEEKARAELIFRSATELQNKGVKVFFYKCPWTPALDQTKRGDFIRSNSQNLAQNFDTFELPGSESFETTDGIHLTESNAKKFALHLIEFARAKGFL
jgi:hypothetical protein